MEDFIVRVTTIYNMPKAYARSCSVLHRPTATELLAQLRVARVPCQGRFRFSFAVEHRPTCGWLSGGENAGS